MRKRTQAQPKTQPRSAYYVFRLRRRSLAEWCGWLIWLIVLGMLVEYAFTSISEDERQAGILAGIIALGLLCAGIIVEVMKSVDLRSAYNDEHISEDSDADSAG